MASNFCISILIKILTIFCTIGVLNGLLTFGYYVLLFKTSLVPLVAGLSFVFFGISLVSYSLIVAAGIGALYQTGLTQVYDSSASCKKNCLTIISGITVTAILIFQFGISIYGLVLSIDILRSQSTACPIDKIHTCRLIVLFFFLTFAFLLLRQEFFKSMNYKNIHVSESYNRLFGIHIKTTTVIKDEVKNVITEVTKKGVTKRITTVTDNNGQTTTEVEFFGPDGKPIEYKGGSRVNGRTLLKTFLFDPRSSIKKTMKLMRQRELDLESGEAMEMKPLST